MGADIVTAMVTLSIPLPVPARNALAAQAMAAGTSLYDWTRRALVAASQGVAVADPARCIIHNPSRSGLLLIGSRPSPGCAPHAICGPRGSRRLRQLLGARIEDVAATANVLQAPLAALRGRAAREAGQRAMRAILSDLDVTTVVVVDEDAAALLRIGAGLMEWKSETKRGATIDVAIAPHPSGRSAWWRDAQNRASGEAFYASLRERQS